MKLTSGAVWGLVVGLVVGVVQGVLGYLAIMSIKDEFVEFVKKTVVEAGYDPEVAEAVVNYTVSQLPISTIGGLALFNILLFLVIGVVMAVVWDRLRVPWLAKGVIFAVVLTAVVSLPRLLLQPPPGAPTPPLLYEVLGVVVFFLGVVALAGVLHLRGRV
jgi:uncharacterized membrane protein YagU involved in acid resistance